ncbi:MAG: radical SAM protein, partial [Actinobacteria bacterium]|nr:radical SAM protein [Actinomycetota bacterium]
YDIAARIKKLKDVPVVMGGAHVTFKSDEALENGADYVVRGEGEETFVELIEYLSSGKGTLAGIEGLSYMENGEARHNKERPACSDLSKYPWPDLTLVEGYEDLKVLPLMTSRGCPFDCKFCSVTSMFGRKYRFRSADDVVEELEMLNQDRRNRTFFFYDDNFTASPKRTKELLRKMIDRGITSSWTAQARVDVVDDTEMMELMRDSGCRFLYLGLESINPATLESYRKCQTVDDIVRAVKIIHKYGIRVHGMFVLGSDEDDKKTIRDTVKFAQKTGIDTVQFLILTPIPGSEFYDEICEQGRLLGNDWSKFTGHNVVFQPKRMSAFKLQKEGAIRSMRKFYSIWQCWKLGLRFQWGNMLLKIYAHHVLSRWKSMNKNYLVYLKRLYKTEKAWLKMKSKEAHGTLTPASDHSLNH